MPIYYKQFSLFKTLTNSSTFGSCQRIFVVRMLRWLFLPHPAHYRLLLDWSEGPTGFPNNMANSFALPLVLKVK